MNITLEKPEEIEITKWNNYLPTLQKIVEKMEAVGIEIVKINPQKSTSYYAGYSDYFQLQYKDIEFNIDVIKLSRMDIESIFYVFDRMEEIIVQSGKVSYEGVFYYSIDAHVKNIAKTGYSYILIYNIICSILQNKKIHIWS